jgi:acyl carrier protein
MGLDGVEIVMKAEEAFDIRIEDGDAEKMLTPGDLIEYVMGKIGHPDASVCLTQRAFNHLRSALIHSKGFERRHIKPDVLMGNLLSKEDGKPFLQQFLADAGVAATPELVRPAWFSRLAIGTSVCVGIFTTIALVQISSKGFNFWSLFAGLLAAILSVWGMMLGTREMRLEFKTEVATIGNFSRWIVAQGPTMYDPPATHWSREQVSLKVREIVIDILACEKNYREDASFVKDLGLC